MKVSHINNFKILNTLNTYKVKRQNSVQKSASYENFAPLPSTNQYLAFTGGYSMDLKQTLQNLDENAFPPDIRQMAQDVIDEGNPEDKKLIDIHKAKYGKINKMKSLEEVKEEFPEFRNVLSDKDVQYFKNSFMDDVKSEKLEWFDADSDLSLQLLQMYWADGFSLNDLKEYTGGKNIISTMLKLNIPRLNRVYGNVLKLSDEEYNKRFTEEMSKKQKGIEKKRKAKENGVKSVPRAPMSEETKRKISDGLIKHYAEHPEKITELSERMKEYYRKNPNCKQRVHNVLLTAWELNEAKPVRKRLSKFLSKPDVSKEEFAKMALEGELSQKTLKEFWLKNPWAGELWSKAMKKGWEIVKTKETEVLKEEKSDNKKDGYEIEIYPPSLKREMFSWFRKKGYDLERIYEPKVYVYFSDKSIANKENFEYSNQSIKDFFEQNYSNEGFVADILQICLLGSLAEINDNYIGKKANKPDFKTRTNAFETCAYIRNKVMEENGSPKVLLTSEIMDIYKKIVFYLMQNNQDDMVQLITDNMEKAYKFIKSNNKQGIFKMYKESSQAVSSLEDRFKMHGTNFAIENTPL